MRKSVAVAVFSDLSPLDLSGSKTISSKRQMPGMGDFLLHLYRKGAQPFRSLSALRDDEATQIMKELYAEGSMFWERFKDPCNYLSFRRRVEQALRKGFIEKGGLPKDTYPIYLVLGRPKWGEDRFDPITLATTDESAVPLEMIDEKEVSFTYPDSMVSALLCDEKNPQYYEPEFHGKVFTLKEIKALVEQKGLPGEGWKTRMPEHLAHYIEAQVWNHDLLKEFFAGKSIG
jgi:hypothetical protein